MKNQKKKKKGYLGTYMKKSNKMNNKEIPQGWWLQISPLARINPEEWIVGVLRKGKASWITEICKDKFKNPQDAHNWGMQWIKEYNEKKKN